MPVNQTEESIDDVVRSGSAPQVHSLDHTEQRALNRVVLGMITLYAGISFWLVSRSWYQADDFIYLWKTDQPGKLLETMFTPYVGHLLPGDFLFTWLSQRPARLNWEINAAMISGGMVIAAILAWRVLRSLLGVRALSVTLMIAYLTSGSIIVTSYWWAAAVEYVPLMIGVPLMIILMQRALINPTRWNSVLPALALIGTLFFFEKALIDVPFLVALIAITPLFPGAAPSARGRLKQAIRPLFPLLSVAVIYGMVYLQISSDEPRKAELSLSMFGRMSPEPIVKTLLPNLVGLGAPELVGVTTAALLAALAALILLIRTIVRYRDGLLAWVLAAGVAFVNLGLLAAAGRRFPMADRYWSDLVFPLLLLVGLSQVGSVHDSRPKKPVVSESSRTGQAIRLLVPSSSFITALAVITFAGISTVNLVQQEPRLFSTAAKSYVATALQSASDVDGPIELFEQRTPSLVMGFLLRPYNITRSVLEPTGGDFSFISSTTDPHIVLDSGEIRPARVKVVRRATGVDPDCSSNSEDQSGRILTLGSNAVSPDRRFGQLAYRSDRSTVIVASWDDRSVAIPVEGGTEVVTFAIDGGDWRRMSISSTDSSLCIRALGVGTLEPR